MKKLAIIGASDLQLPLIEKAKALGLETHVFAWKAGDVGESAADFFYPISITETDRITEVCGKIAPDGVATIGSDLAAITVIRVASALGLPCNPPETSVIATNKFRMRETFLQAGIPVPRFTETGERFSGEIIRGFSFPLIVKPTDRSGSRGIFRAERPEEIPEAVKAACSQSFEKKAIIEEFIEGEEFSCECISQHGKHHMLAVTRKYTTGAPHFIEIGHLEPSGLDADQCAEVRKQVFQALDALHVQLGASHSEFRIDPESGKIRIIEIGARMGGDCIGSDLVQLTTGQDYVEMVIRCALGQEIRFEEPAQHGFAAVRYILTEKDYEHYRSMKAENRPELVRWSAVRRPEPGKVTDSSARYGFYIAVGSSGERVLETADLPQGNPF